MKKDIDIHKLLEDNGMGIEKIVWQGRPVSRLLFRDIDILYIPFYIVGLFVSLLSFGLLLELTSDFIQKPKDIFSASIFPVVLCALIIYMTYYFVFGRFLIKLKNNRIKYYALTNDRVLIISIFKHCKKLEVESVYLNDIPQIRIFFRRWSKEVGDIRFGKKSFWGTELLVNTGLEGGSVWHKEVPSFYDVDNVNSVYAIVKEVLINNGYSFSEKRFASWNWISPLFKSMIVMNK